MTASCEGLLLRIRSVNLSLNRPGFILNGTNCAPLSAERLGGLDPFGGTTAGATAALGASSGAARRFPSHRS